MVFAYVVDQVVWDQAGKRGSFLEGFSTLLCDLVSWWGPYAEGVIDTPDLTHGERVHETVFPARQGRLRFDDFVPPVVKIGDEVLCVFAGVEPHFAWVRIGADEGGKQNVDRLPYAVLVQLSRS